MRQILIALVIAIVVIGVSCGLIFRRESPTPDNSGDFGSEYDAFQRDMYYQLSLPLHDARESVDPVCAEVPIAAENASCARYVDEIRRIQASMPALAARLTGLIAVAPDTTNPELISAMYKLLNAIQGVRRSNELLLKGWDNSDSDSWKQGWDLREKLKDDALATSTPTVAPSPSATRAS